MRVLAISALFALTACNAQTAETPTPTAEAAVATPHADVAPATPNTAAPSNDTYLDDRSTAPAIINSYYNAINRKEYARAWSYRGEGSDVQAYDIFKKGFANTKTADVRLGEAAMIAATSKPCETN